jgi:hypothetical protein
MKFDILNRFTREVQFTAEINCDNDASASIKIGLAVKWAIKTGADLAGADLAGASLAGALKIDEKDIPVIPNIDAAILAAIEGGGKLDMGSWHGRLQDR